jgi:hypothetical protein
MLGSAGRVHRGAEAPDGLSTAAVDYVMILNDGPHGYTLNGKSFPATEPIVATRGSGRASAS